MQDRLDSILESRWLWLVARILMAAVFVSSGLAKLLNFEGGMAEMRAAGLTPEWLFNIAVIITLLAGSALILLDRMVWLGAAALSGFLALTILIVHHFWALPDPGAKIAMFFALEHISLIGGLFSIAIASHARGLSQKNA